MATSEGIDGYVVGAYAASPAHAIWDPVAEGGYFDLLARDPRIGALELPWMGSLHPHDATWLLGHWPTGLDAVMTDVPWVARQIGDDPLSGLASLDGDGRLRALGAVRRLRDDVRRLADAAGADVVRVVELHSSPRASLGGVEPLTRSLDEIGGWEWDGTELVVEHCDALRPQQVPEKGFLELGDEIAAIRLAGAEVGISINWGRSAIELRDADAVVDQVAEAAASGLLRGLIVSGASDREGVFGPPWVDAHHPFRRSSRHPWGDPSSLLTEERVAACFAAAGRLDWRGVKVGWPQSVPGTVEQRVDMIGRALDALDRVGA